MRECQHRIAGCRANGDAPTRPATATGRRAVEVNAPFVGRTRRGSDGGVVSLCRSHEVAIGPLHADVEVEFPARFIEDVRNAVAALGDVELPVGPGGRVHFVGKQHLRDAASPERLLVVARVVPAAMHVQGTMVDRARAGGRLRIGRMAGPVHPLSPVSLKAEQRVASEGQRLVVVAALKVIGLDGCGPDHVVRVVCNPKGVGADVQRKECRGSSRRASCRR